MSFYKDEEGATAVELGVIFVILMIIMAVMVAFVLILYYIGIASGVF